MFALDLYVPDEKGLVSKRTPGIGIERDVPQTAQSGKQQQHGHVEEVKEERKEVSAELSAFLKGIDEADKGRLEVTNESCTIYRTLFITFPHQRILNNIGILLLYPTFISQ